MNKFLVARTIVVVLGFLCWLNSCQSAKPLETEVRIKLHEALPITITKDNGATFITFYTEDDYRKVFIDELKKSLAINKVVVDNVNPQFRIFFNELHLNETTTTDTVKDRKTMEGCLTLPLQN